MRTGVARRLGDWLNATAGSGGRRMPGVADAGSQRARCIHEFDRRGGHIHPGRAAHLSERGRRAEPVDDALSFAALISGMLTLVATAPNLVATPS